MHLPVQQDLVAEGQMGAPLVPMVEKQGVPDLVTDQGEEEQDLLPAVEEGDNLLQQPEVGAVTAF